MLLSKVGGTTGVTTGTSMTSSDAFINTWAQTMPCTPLTFLAPSTLLAAHLGAYILPLTSSSPQFLSPRVSSGSSSTQLSHPPQRKSVSSLRVATPAPATRIIKSLLRCPEAQEGHHLRNIEDKILRIRPTWDT
jgi:hypothetical protein